MFRRRTLYKAELGEGGGGRFFPQRPESPPKKEKPEKPRSHEAILAQIAMANQRRSHKVDSPLND
ncbi:MAG TPA: hypothetical protein HA254_02560 [Candidatus Diapherotrites archaeon]|uniref:Uncharacterized protein n=1 Tax=Candidatus Iainarchaeum sp. TaxID=3101447 RepID=A0A7J4IXF0_9ARCH|nr:hypothetical protein [Candidatus Diapherotrites archaeon]